MSYRVICLTDKILNIRPENDVTVQKWENFNHIRKKF